VHVGVWNDGEVRALRGDELTTSPDVATALSERERLQVDGLLGYVGSDSHDGAWLALEPVRGPTVEAWRRAAKEMGPDAATAVHLFAQLTRTVAAVYAQSDRLPTGPVQDVVWCAGHQPHVGSLGELGGRRQLPERRQVDHLRTWCLTFIPPGSDAAEQLAEVRTLVELESALDTLAARPDLAFSVERATRLRDALQLRDDPTGGSPEQATELAAPPRHEAPAGGPRASWVVAEKYRVLRLIGSGATGDVFEVRHLVSGRDLALKILHHTPRSPRAGEVFRQSFLREASALAKLHHPHIVSLLDYGTKDETWLALEIVDGPSLKDLLTLGPLDPKMAVAIARQVCAGLNVAHDLGLVHRDIKPGNVLVGHDDPVHVKLADFGLSKSWEDTDHVEEGTVVGTPQYMAPEQCEGEAATHRSDLYSVGVLLFEMLTGVTPFADHSGLSVLLAHMGRAPPRLVDAAGTPFPSLLEEVVARCMSKDPADRYACAADLDADLARCVVQLRHPDQVPGHFSRPSHTSEGLRYLVDEGSLPSPDLVVSAPPRRGLVAAALLVGLGVVAAVLGWTAFGPENGSSDNASAAMEVPLRVPQVVPSESAPMPASSRSVPAPVVAEPVVAEPVVPAPPSAAVRPSPKPTAVRSTPTPRGSEPPAPPRNEPSPTVAPETNPFAAEEELVNPFGEAP